VRSIIFGLEIPEVEGRIAGSDFFWLIWRIVCSDLPPPGTSIWGRFCESGPGKIYTQFSGIAAQPFVSLINLSMPPEVSRAT
jgi:hypothetical protein